MTTSFHVDHACEILERTPAVLRAMLSGVGEHWALRNYGEGTFSPFDVVGHLIHGERTDWIPRLRRILDHGESRPFEPFDRFAMHAASRGKSIDDLLDEFARLRAENLVVLRASSLTAEQLAVRGTHPALGSVTIGELLATWTVHDLNHVRQIAKAMAWQYRDDVGPWRTYLPILTTP